MLWICGGKERGGPSSFTDGVLTAENLSSNLVGARTVVLDAWLVMSESGALSRIFLIVNSK